MEARHVRLVIALFAATGVHALLLLRPAAPFPKIMHNSMLSVDLSDASVMTSAPPRMQSSDAVQSAKAQAKSSTHILKKHLRVIPSHTRTQIAGITAKSLRHESSAATQTTHTPASRQTASSKSKAVQSVTRNMVKQQDNGIQDASFHTTKVAMSGQMSSRIRSLLLAHIEYPRPARRRGWQGKGEFQLMITRKNVHKVKMLASTGYRQLDQAAKRGLLAAGHIQLDDGIYNLPVEFRLQ